MLTRLIGEKLELKKWTSEVMLKPMGYDLLANKFTVVIKSGSFAKKFIVKVSSELQPK